MGTIFPDSVLGNIKFEDTFVHKFVADTKHNYDLFCGALTIFQAPPTVLLMAPAWQHYKIWDRVFHVIAQFLFHLVAHYWDTLPRILIVVSIFFSIIPNITPI